MSGRRRNLFHSKGTIDSGCGNAGFEASTMHGEVLSLLSDGTKTSPSSSSAPLPPFCTALTPSTRHSLLFTIASSAHANRDF
jgi:hypothetical protein